MKSKTVFISESGYQFDTEAECVEFDNLHTMVEKAATEIALKIPIDGQQNNKSSRLVHSFSLILNHNIQKKEAPIL